MDAYSNQKDLTAHQIVAIMDSAQRRIHDGYQLCADSRPGFDMYAHRIKITIPESREITLRLPGEAPTGEAELIVLTDFPAARESVERFKTWLDSWIRTLPDSPAVPLAALRREKMHE